MGESHGPILKLPSWVRKRNGRVVPFDSDKICHCVFAVTESLEEPDVLLARDLTSGILYFLAEEAEGPTITTEDIAEVVVKVIRELGQPRLADAFEARSRQSDLLEDEDFPFSNESQESMIVPFELQAQPEEAQRACARKYALQVSYAREVARAHNEGLITLVGLESATTLAGWALKSTYPPRDLIANLASAAEVAGQVIVLDQPERTLASTGIADLEQTCSRFLSDLRLGLKLTRREVILNCNLRTVPPWAAVTSLGPLFAVQSSLSDEIELQQASDVLVELFSRAPWEGQAWIDWHLTAKDFESSERERLTRIARHALMGAPIRFVFDRSKRATTLAEGTKRDSYAVLLTVGLQLSTLITIVQAEDHSQWESSFFEKLKSLTRLALSAGVQKRKYLRARLPEDSPLRRGFLLDRACLIVTPQGLDTAVKSLTGHRLCEGEKMIALGRRILSGIQELLVHEGRLAGLEAFVDSPLGAEIFQGAQERTLAGVTCYDEKAQVRAQLQAIGKLHHSIKAGTGIVLLPRDVMSSPKAIIDWLSKAWRQGDAVRLRFARIDSGARQLTLEQS